MTPTRKATILLVLASLVPGCRAESAPGLPRANRSDVPDGRRKTDELGPRREITTCAEVVAGGPVIGAIHRIRFDELDYDSGARVFCPGLVIPPPDLAWVFFDLVEKRLTRAGAQVTVEGLQQLTLRSVVLDLTVVHGGDEQESFVAFTTRRPLRNPAEVELVSGQFRGWDRERGHFSARLDGQCSARACDPTQLRVVRP